MFSHPPRVLTVCVRINSFPISYFETSLYIAQYRERNAKFAQLRKKKTTLKTTDTTKSVAQGIFYTITKIICYY